MVITLYPDPLDFAHANVIKRRAQIYTFPPVKTAAAKYPYIVVLTGAFRVGFSALVLEPIPDGTVANSQFGSNLSQGMAFRP